MILYLTNVTLILVFSTLFTVSYTHFLSTTTILCIGDSITQGVGASSAEKSYPGRLSELLMFTQSNSSRKYHNYSVFNYGVKNTLLNRRSDASYWKTEEYKSALSLHRTTASIVIILLGANDAKYAYSWNETEFIVDYLDLIHSFRALESKPKIYLCIPTVILPWYASTKVNSTLINVVYPQLIPEIARISNSSYIDLFSALGGNGSVVTKFCIQYFVRDGLHPNDKGYLRMAEVVRQRILTHDTWHSWRVNGKQSLLFYFFLFRKD